MKPKNKKILALLCLPLLMITMILPLCSFIPGLVDPNGINRTYDYSPAYGLNVDVGVEVQLNGNGITNNYIGYVYDVLNCTVNYDEESEPIGPFIDSYSYYVSSAYRSSLDFFNDDLSVNYELPSGGFMIDYAVALEGTSEFDEGTEFIVSTYFDGRFDITYAPSEISDNFVSLYFYDANAGYQVPLSNFYISGRILYEYLDSTGVYVNYGYLNFSFQRLDILYSDSDFIIFTYDLAMDILDKFDVNVNNVTNILSFDFELDPIDSSLTFNDVVGSCIIACSLMPVEYAEAQYLAYLSERNSQWYGLGYEQGYDNGYNLGYNVGVADAPEVWGSFSTFLSTTVGGFLDMQILPGVTITGILSVILSISLVILFLKLFAGG